MLLLSCQGLLIIFNLKINRNGRMNIEFKWNWILILNFNFLLFNFELFNLGHPLTWGENDEIEYLDEESIKDKE